jgi:lipid-binding SYLF domain-containing protein
VTADLDPARDAPVRAGGVGEDNVLDIVPNAGVLTYGRTGGLFAGISLSGASLRPDDGANEALYGREVDARALLSGAAPETIPLAARPFIEAIESAAETAP